MVITLDLGLQKKITLVYFSFPFPPPPLLLLYNSNAMLFFRKKKNHVGGGRGKLNIIYWTILTPGYPTFLSQALPVPQPCTTLLLDPSSLFYAHARDPILIGG